MKKFIKITALALAIASIGSVAFAQTSQTSKSTATLFETDVDKFMNVITWQDVQPKTAFVTLNPRTDALDVGFSKYFNSIYVGAYYYGNLFTENSKQTDNNGNVTKAASGYNDFSLLFGIKNWGIKVVFYNSADSDTSINKDPSFKQIQSNSEFSISLDAGTKIDNGSKIFTPSFGAKFTNYKNAYQKSTDSNGVIDVTNNQHNKLSIYGGTGIDFAKKGIVQNKLNLNADVFIVLYPKYDSYTKDSNGIDGFGQKHSEFEVSLNPSYTATITPAKNISIKAQLDLPLLIDSEKTGKSITCVDGKDTEGPDYTEKNTVLKANLFANLAVQYAVKPEVFNINLGCALTSPTFYIGNSYAKDGAADPEKTKMSGISGSVYTNVYTGFSYNFSKTVLLDFNWNIVSVNINGSTTSLDDAWNKSASIGISAKF